MKETAAPPPIQVSYGVCLKIWCCCLNNFQWYISGTFIDLFKTQFADGRDKLSGDPALNKEQPDKTIYLSFAVQSKPNPNYHHELYYSHKAMQEIQKDQPSIQINHISFKVSLPIECGIVDALRKKIHWMRYVKTYLTVYRSNMWIFSWRALPCWLMPTKISSYAMRKHFKGKALIVQRNGVNVLTELR